MIIETLYPKLLVNLQIKKLAMEIIKIQINEVKSFGEDYDWSAATDANDKKLFSTPNEFNYSTMQSIFNQFDFIEIGEDDAISGVYLNGQKILIAKAPFIFKKASLGVESK